MPLIQRVRDILLRPRETWPVIATEQADAASLYRRHVAILAAVPAIATFIGLTIIGVNGIRLPIAVGLLQLVIGYALALITVYVLALIADALAPTFGGTRGRIPALKLIAYASTAGFVGGIFNLFPMLSILGLLAAVYSMFLIYTGLPVLMRCPAEKAAAYAAVLVVCGLVATVILAGITAMIVPAGPMVERVAR